MTYVALLRGINVGGNNKVPMKDLKTVFQNLGLKNIKTYINSGNILFQDTHHKKEELVTKLEKAIENKFGFAIKVLIRTFAEIKKVNEALPKDWLNNSDMKCDVMFLWETVDKKSIMDELIIKKDIDEVKYIKGTLLWRVDRDKVTKSGLLRLVGTPLYKEMTIRNCNTARKLFTLMQEMEK